MRRVETQEALTAGVGALRAAAAAVQRLALFSSNETLDDVATADLKYLLVPFYLAEARATAHAAAHRAALVHPLTHALLARECVAAAAAHAARPRAHATVQLLVQSRAEDRAPLVAGALAAAAAAFKRLACCRVRVR